MNNGYEVLAYASLISWQQQMQRKPGLINRLSKKVQVKINSWIPEKLHQAITITIKQLIRGVIFGAKYTTLAPILNTSLEIRETAILQKINTYRYTAAVDGGITGAGGILLGLADFPILLTIKLKLLYDIAAGYGFDVTDFKERVYLLHIFELAFSSEEHRNLVYTKITNWETQRNSLPDDIHQFDWRSLQQEYRDYIDLAKMAQLVPIIGAPVGVWVNHRLIKKLGITAMNAYRMRLLTS